LSVIAPPSNAKEKVGVIVMRLLRRDVKRVLLGATMCGLLLSTCSSVAWAQSAPKNRLQLETAACKLISSTPESASGDQVAISVQKSTLAALTKTGNKSFESVVRAFNEAALAEDNDAMIHAINNGVRVCHRLGLKTAL
jgi:hypothetical protein